MNSEGIRNSHAFMSATLCFFFLLFEPNLLAQQANPPTAEDFAKQGNACMVKGQFDNAIEAYSNAISLNQNLAEAFYGRALAWYAERLKGEIGPEDYDVSDPWEARDRIIKKLRKSYAKAIERALEDLTKAIKIDPNFAAAYADRGAIKEEKGDYKGALNDFNKAIELNQRIARAYYNRGNLWQRKNELESAIVDYDKAIEIDPRHSKAYNNRGMARHIKRDFRGAIKDFDNAIALTPEDPYPYANRGNSRVELGENEAALADFNKAISLDPKLADAYASRGLLLLRLGKDGDAYQDFELCSSIDARWAPVLEKKIREIKQSRPLP